MQNFASLKGVKIYFWGVKQNGIICLWNLSAQRSGEGTARASCGADERAKPESSSKPQHMNKGYVVFLAVAAFVTLIACTQYLQLQSEITNRSERITALQQELANRKEANTTRYNAIVNSINLEEVRERAMNDLGMVYAQEEQVITYKNPANVSVRQYADIPESGVVASSEVVK